MCPPVLSLLSGRFHCSHAGTPCSILESLGPGSPMQGFAWTGGRGERQAPTQLFLVISTRLGGGRPPWEDRQMSVPRAHTAG